MAGLPAIHSAKMSPLGEAMGKEKKKTGFHYFSFIKVLLLDSYTCLFLIALEYELLLVDC